MGVLVFAAPLYFGGNCDVVAAGVVIHLQSHRSYLQVVLQTRIAPGVAPALALVPADVIVPSLVCIQVHRCI